LVSVCRRKFWRGGAANQTFNAYPMGGNSYSRRPHGLVVFVGPSALYNWQKSHRYAFVGLVVVTIRLALLFFVVWYVAPRATSLFGVWLHG